MDGVLMLRSGAVTYPSDGIENLARIERDHFWFETRNRVIINALRESFSNLHGKTALDVGCGTGFVLRALEAEGMLGCGLDISLPGLRIARRQTQAPLVCVAPDAIPFSTAFDVVLLCDVIEHSDDDTTLLHTAAASLKSGGRVLLTVPAHPALWSAADEISGHRRRYTRRSLTRTMRAAGLNIELVRYFHASLIPPQFLQRLALSLWWRHADAQEEPRMRADVGKVPPKWANHLLSAATSLELKLCPRGLPFGCSLIAVGRAA